MSSFFDMISAALYAILVQNLVFRGGHGVQGRHAKAGGAVGKRENVLRAADGLMTAAQLEAACTSGISKHEVAGNLLAMKTKHSRYEYVGFFCGQQVPRVNIPHEDFRGKGERIVTKGGGKREAVMVELDENGHIIPNSKRKVMLNESKRYGIEKTK